VVLLWNIMNILNGSHRWLPLIAPQSCGPSLKRHEHCKYCISTQPTTPGSTTIMWSFSETTWTLQISAHSQLPLVAPQSCGPSLKQHEHCKCQHKAHYPWLIALQSCGPSLKRHEHCKYCISTQPTTPDSTAIVGSFSETTWSLQISAHSPQHLIAPQSCGPSLKHHEHFKWLTQMTTHDSTATVWSFSETTWTLQYQHTSHTHDSMQSCGPFLKQHDHCKCQHTAHNTW
jgi:hypothetical protein